MTWWIPLTDPIDLPDKHTQVSTSFLPPSVAAPDGEALTESDNPFLKRDHEVRLTAHQRSYEAPIADPVQELVFDTSVGSTGKPPSEPPHSSTHYVSIIEAKVVVYGQENVDNELTSDLFDLALARVRQLQEATALLTGKNMDWVARERLPSVLPTQMASSSSQENEDGRGMFLTGVNALTSVSPPEPLDATRIEHLNEYLRRDEEGVSFSAYHRLRYETMIMLHRRGDYRMTVVSAAIAAEALLNEMLLMLLWDEGRRPEDVAPMFNPDESSVRSRVKSEYSRHLGGNWNLKKKGPVRDWREKVAEPRNAIAHAGFMSTSEQARDSLEALLALEKFLGKRLVEKVQKRPRTAMMYLGSDRIAAEGKMTKKLRRFYNDPNEPHWTSTFCRWRTLVDMEITQARGAQISPSAEDAVLLAVGNTEQPTYVLLDETVQMAVKIAAVPESIQEQYQRGLESSDMHGAPAFTVTRLKLDHIEDKVQLPHDGSWQYSYHLVPTERVMSDGSDCRCR